MSCSGAGGPPYDTGLAFTLSSRAQEIGTHRMPFIQPQRFTAPEL